MGKKNKEKFRVNVNISIFDFIKLENNYCRSYQQLIYILYQIKGLVGMLESRAALLSVYIWLCSFS